MIKVETINGIPCIVTDEILPADQAFLVTFEFDWSKRQIVVKDAVKLTGLGVERTKEVVQNERKPDN